jgi:LuxR family maltose regulon positive regulatory protein
VLERAAATAASAGIASTEVEARALLGLLLMGTDDDRAGCEWAEQAAAVFAYHDLAQMTSTSAVLAVADVARCAVQGDRAGLDQAVSTLRTVLPQVEALFPWYRPLAGGVLAFASVRSGDLARFHDYARWCEESGAPPEALCRMWATRAEREFASMSPLRVLSPAELRVWHLLKGRKTLGEIGAELFLSRETVKSHTMSIYRKLGVTSRREAQDLAESWG